MPTVQANTIQLHYESHGTGQPLVFTHGLYQPGFKRITYCVFRIACIACAIRRSCTVERNLV